MWRLWTEGFGVRYWWRWLCEEGLPLWFARHLPARVALWAFVVVYCSGNDSSGPEYSHAYSAWSLKHWPGRQAIALEPKGEEHG